MKREKTAVKMIMEKPMAVLHPEDTVYDAVSAFSCRELREIPVTDREGRFMGVVTSARLFEWIYREGGMEEPVTRLIKKNVKILDTSDVITIDETEGIFRFMYVCEQGRLRGVITASGLINFCRWSARLYQKFEKKCLEYEMIFNHCYDSIYEIDAEGVVLMANAATKRITGREPSEVEGKNIREIEDRRIYFPSVVNAVLKQKKTVTILQNVKDNNQAVVTGVPVFDEKGNLYRIISITRDAELLIDQIEDFVNSGELLELYERLRSNEKLADLYFAELRQLRTEQIEEKKINTHNREMQEVLDVIKKVGPVDSNVLILGESGVGKDLAAGMIHNISHRRKNPFVKINCGAIPEKILESELFGYEEGAFTGAQKNGKRGLLEIADGGTVFLNEIGEMPMNLQVKLLQAIQDRSFMRIGGLRPVKVDIRIISATNKDLEEMVKKNLFREDLYYRLNVIPILIPPLRERKEDIPELVMTFLDAFNKKHGRNKQVSSMTMKRLINYEWPGNVRELENIIERLVVVSHDDTIYPNDLPPYLASREKARHGEMIYEDGMKLQEVLDRVEKQVLAEVYGKYGSTTRAAEVLGVNQSTIVRKLAKYGLCKNK
ncbi:sigma 54-interacting transcriptional regulator [Bacilliculturomica massiliensis]|uniref:sigma 54-interacting transcriptional regulator n=1 Tax=Bacilliculturomica massiliensis TaxID=1917867 RepID=UPI0013EF52F3|nr:sigma 54-interacting transcriptional regulator [Bacilliculturomica massiliensis]